MQLYEKDCGGKAWAGEAKAAVDSIFQVYDSNEASSACQESGNNFQRGYRLDLKTLAGIRC